MIGRKEREIVLGMMCCHFVERIGWKIRNRARVAESGFSQVSSNVIRRLKAHLDSFQHDC